MKLIKVDPYNDKHVIFMYNMLDERDDTVAISFEMPTLLEHQRFLLSNPYDAWYLIEYNGKLIGNIYLTDRSEWGYYIAKVYQNKGLGTKALQELVKLHPRDYYYANINEKNERAIHQARDKFKGKLIQITYKIRRDDILNLE